ncbi:hypothetical protein CTI12_AA449140 [Artemisia annua]|uniref:FMN-dependent dehydrogenase domain-containing protein n=1 Tax=Artemisia annua TaxID=35608 RepID=A0A2U1LVG2_ARTAN|nr:hypothetical protein CTI12_AA449140 [Artemisia annua]
MVVDVVIEHDCDKEDAWIMTPISLLQNPNQVRPARFWVYTKLRIFNMTDYKKDSLQCRATTNPEIDYDYIYIAENDVDQVIVKTGRPVVYRLAAKGEYGARRVIEMLKDELELTMALSGCPTLNDISSLYYVVSIYFIKKQLNNILLDKIRFNDTETDP